MSPSQFTLAFDRAAHTHGFVPARVNWPESVGSTNDELVSELIHNPEEWPDFSVYGTEFQNAGKGRLDRQWTVQPGEALTFSTLFRVGEPSEAIGWIPLLTGWAVAQALSDCGVNATVKWPNDVLIDGKKVCGILCRYVPEAGAVVIGAGLNVSLSQLPVDTATSVHLHAEVDRADLLARILAHLHHALTEAFAPGVTTAQTDIVAQACARISTIGQQVRVSLPGGEALVGEAVGISSTADLQVKTDAGIVDVSAGDVVHVRPA